MGENASLNEVRRSRRALDRTLAGQKLARTKLEAAMIRAAESGASQREVAAVAGVSQPYVHRVLTEHKGRFVPRSPLGFQLAAYRNEIIDLLQRHAIDKAAVFGSVARGEDGPDSDIDVVADVPSSMGLIGLAKVEQELQELLGVGVDLVPSRLMKQEVREAALADEVPL